MNTRMLAAIRCSLLLLVSAAAYAGSAQWNLNPTSGDWNTAANWTPMGIPNGPADIATFGLSNTTNVSISANTEVNSIVFTPAATNPYGITAGPGLTLAISGVGITNNSGRTQGFVIASDPSFHIGTLLFSNSATAGSNISIFNEGGSINFFNRSSAGSASIENDGFADTNFFDRSTAGSASIVDSFSSTIFFDRSSAGSASIFTQISSVVYFLDNSTAGSASIGVCDNCVLGFANTSTAGSASITATGPVTFYDSSRGGTAQINLLTLSFGFIAYLDISGHNAPGLTIGSLAGNGASFDSPGSFVLLGANNLTIGTNNLSTTFSGAIEGLGGSLTKIGTGTLDLTGANDYTGDTNVNRGVLQVDGSIISNTFVNRGSTLAGTGTINGNVSNNGGVSPGSAGAPGTLTVVGNYTQAQYATLMIQIAGANTGEFSVLDVLGTANLSGQLDPVLLNGFVPTIGQSFTFLNYGAVNGTLFMFNPNIDNLPEHWDVSYFPTYAILTVVAGNVPVPDQGSTFLLLTLGLLGLVTYGRQLLRGQT
jgi:autotransporter-associated beta strand protein